jgi:hypothetical protein
MSNVIEASAISIGCHQMGTLLSVLAGPTVVANIRLSEDLADNSTARYVARANRKNAYIGTAW